MPHLLLDILGLPYLCAEISNFQQNIQAKCQYHILNQQKKLDCHQKFPSAQQKKGVGVFGGGSKKMPTQKKSGWPDLIKKNNSVSPQELHLPGSKAQSVVVKGFGTPEASGEKDGGGYMFNLKNT